MRHSSYLVAPTCVYQGLYSYSGRLIVRSFPLPQILCPEFASSIFIIRSVPGHIEIIFLLFALVNTLNETVSSLINMYIHKCVHWSEMLLFRIGYDFEGSVISTIDSLQRLSSCLQAHLTRP
jgi:hypothetical protein